jgi:hypothetical protein
MVNEIICGISYSPDRVVIVRVLTESETCHIFKAVLRIIKTVTYNLSGVSNFIT